MCCSYDIVRGKGEAFLGRFLSLKLEPSWQCRLYNLSRAPSPGRGGSAWSRWRTSLCGTLMLSSFTSPMPCVLILNLLPLICLLYPEHSLFSTSPYFYCACNSFCFQPHSLFFVCFCGTRGWIIQAFPLARQVLCYLSYSTRPFCIGYFEINSYFTSGPSILLFVPPT
jgi:hypothetical protein